MIDKSNLLKSHGSLYLEFIHKDWLFHKMFYCHLWDFELVYVTSTILSPCTVFYLLHSSLFIYCLAAMYEYLLESGPAYRLRYQLIIWRVDLKTHQFLRPFLSNDHRATTKLIHVGPTKQLPL